ncbi:MAG: hypothetical protein Q4C54_00990 [Clostridia bacterium]|nr:hypothetical protein [Clostridia bacterium]
MLTKEREQLRMLMAQAGFHRRPALKRCQDPDYLMATDFPAAASEEQTEVFVHSLQNHGWLCTRKGNWLFLDKESYELPNPPVPDTIPAGEIGCCISLLQRHMSDCGDIRLVRLLMKTADESAQKTEALCLVWHREWAAGLRRG